MPDVQEAISLEGVSKTYRSKTGNVEALKEVNLTVPKSVIHGVIGHSGSGKSTLLRAINGLERIDEGRVLVDGNDITGMSYREQRRLRRQTSMIFQKFNLLRNDTALSNIALALHGNGNSHKEIQLRAEELLGVVGLHGRGKAYPSQLSGGQQQRVAIARALANNPSILLCDEPTSALDPDTTHTILGLLGQLNKDMGITILLITHQMTVIKEVCDSVSVINDGRIIQTGSVSDVFLNPASPVTEQFSSSLLDRANIDRALRSEYTRNVIASGGVAVQLLFTGLKSNEAMISAISTLFNVQASIIYGNIEYFKTEPVGTLYVTIRGERVQVAKALGFLRERDVRVKILQGSEMSYV